MSVPNGSAPEAKTKKGPSIVGINFGNTYASIAVINKEGLSDCIANEDGERQISCAVSFHGEEMYIGNQAKPQLIKNAQNTIINFRNLLGKKFSEIPKDQPVTSAPVIQHPDQPDVAAYKVAILQPAPTPLPAASVKSSVNTPAASVLPTPRSEPIPGERILTVQEVTTIFLRSLVQSAQDFLGRRVEGAVITVPSWFDENARVALEAAASDADINVLQLVDETGAAALVSVTSPVDGLHPDRNSLLVDFGQSSLSLSLLSIRHGLIHCIASVHDHGINANQIDEKLVKHFAKEFTKKTKTPLTVCPSTDNADKRAEAKLRLSIEHTKRTVSASAGAASCSVESLKDGVDFTGNINRLRFDMEVRSIYDTVVNKSIELVESVVWEPFHIDEIIYAGGSASLPGLDELFFARGFPETMITPFTAGTVIGGGIGDPTSILARGAALQARLLSEIPEENVEIREGFKSGSQHAKLHATAKAIGLILPGNEGDELGLGGKWVEGVPRETPLPYRRIVQFACELAQGSKNVGFDLWEVNEGVKITKVKLPKDESSDAGDDQEEEEEETREKIITKATQLGSLVFEAKHEQKQKGSKSSQTTVQVQFVVGPAGGAIVTACEISTKGEKGKTVSVVVPPVVHS